MGEVDVGRVVSFVTSLFLEKIKKDQDQLVFFHQQTGLERTALLEAQATSRYAAFWWSPRPRSMLSESLPFDR